MAATRRRTAPGYWSDTSESLTTTPLEVIGAAVGGAAGSGASLAGVDAPPPACDTRNQAPPPTKMRHVFSSSRRDAELSIGGVGVSSSANTPARLVR